MLIPIPLIHITIQTTKLYRELKKVKIKTKKTVIIQSYNKILNNLLILHKNDKKKIL